MAIFTAVRNKKQTAGTMGNVMKYVTQEKKTMLGERWMVTGHNCVAQSSYLEMMTTKRRFQKTDGRQFYHFVQSFSAEDRLTPQEVNAIGVEFARKQFPDFEVIVATHMAKPQYAILRFAKYKGPGIHDIEAHNERTKDMLRSRWRRFRSFASPPNPPKTGIQLPDKQQIWW